MSRGSISFIFICPTPTTGPATKQVSENSHKMNGLVNWEGRKDGRKRGREGGRERGREGGREEANE